MGVAGALGEFLGLEGVEQVADEDRHRRSREHAAINEFRREPEDEPAERVYQEELAEIVERQPEKPVNVAANDPSHARENNPGAEISGLNLFYK